MRKLQIEQCFENIQTTYDQPSITWQEDCAEFTLNGNDPTSGQLTVWQDAVTPEQVFTGIDGLKRKIDQFLLAMQVTSNARMRKKNEPIIKYYAKDGQEFEVSTSFPEVINFILKHERGEPYSYISASFPKMTLQASMISSSVSLSSTLPQASLGFERLIGIFSLAEDFSGPYLVEHQLRNYFLIMEELCDEKMDKTSSKPDFYNDLKKVRDFVSHGICDYNNTRSFILEKFPELEVMGENGKKYIRFDRTQDSHINFISTYRDKAYFWVKEQLEYLSRPSNN